MESIHLEVCMRDFDWYVISTLQETGSITKTAELLYTTQPAITKRLQAIEQEFGCRLVMRTPKGVAFTPAGNKIVEKARIIIDTMQKIREAGGEAYSYASDYEIIGALKQFADRYNICILTVHHTRKNIL